MTVFKRADSPNWFIEFQYLGQTVRQSSGTPSKATAKALEQRLRREIQDRVAAGKLPTILFGDAIDRYFDTVLSPRGKDKVRAKDIYVLDKLRARFGAETPLDAITSADIARYRDELVTKHKLAPSTANREISYMRAIINRAANDWNISTAPFRVKMFREPPGRVRWLTPAEEKRLLDECSFHLRPIVTFLMDTGCRKDEALSLMWRDVTFEKGRARIRIEADRTKNATATGKAVPKRTTRLLRALYKNRPEGADHVFLFVPKTKKGKTPRPTRPLGNIQIGFKAACRRAKIEDFNIHDLRHHYASRLVQRGVPIQRVQRLLGHKSMRMTERYAHLAPSDLDDAVAVLDR
ncbi:MAG: site-specific integrase [Alphaproteobacteria bacterium]|nr:site-specific integrase [Alphaproteobacteria bacterium]